MNETVGKALGNIAGRFHLYDFCSMIGLEAIFYRHTYKNKLIETKRFYAKAENQKRIAKTMDMFQEEESRRTFQRSILFRQYHTLRTRPKKCKEAEYFNSITNHIGSEETFVDCGGYNGDTVISFVRFAKGNYKKITVFEPDKYNMAELQKNTKDFHDCYIHNEGVWNENGTISFQDGNLGGSSISLKGGGTIQTVMLDGVEDCKDASFIKMDIEGAELNALIGGAALIKRNRPILAICLYHTDEDMLSIPEWMRDNLSDYQYFCRHHSYYMQETIMYAVPKERYGKEND